jgi:hypothetical protein
MIITNAKWNRGSISGETSSLKATIDGSELNIPMDTANRHYAEILKQVADGDITIAEAD